MKKEWMNYEPIIAGLLLKFESIDNVDFSLIIEDFKEKTKVDVLGLWYDAENISKYMKCEKNGTILLRDGITLDYFIEEENCTLREKLLKVAGDKVANYFNNLDIEKYKTEKEKTLKDNKEKVLNGANILLISDIQEDYDELIKYGFKNVDYFKSIIRADNYFSKHSGELEKYQLILRGNQNVRNYYSSGIGVELDRVIDRLRDERHVLESTLDRYDCPDHIELVTYLIDRNNDKCCETRELTYQGIFDRIVENMLINHTLEKVNLEDKKFVPIQDYINPNRLPLPAKKSDLKILYLGSIWGDKYTDRIINELGLNVEFKEDNNYSLDRYVKRNLGEYDIIIATLGYSGNLLSMNRESTEQCKDTGRELTLFVVQNDFYWNVDSNLADGVKLGYVFGGNYAPDFGYHSKEIRILRQSIEGEDKYWTKYDQDQYSRIKGIIEASVNFYNEVLFTISDLDFKTADEIDNEYVSAIEAEIKKKEAELAPIKLFDNIRYSITSYLNYRQSGLINQIPEGLRITEGKDGIKVENIYQGRILCTIVFSKEYKHNHLRIFEIQTLSKKGTLSSPQTIGVYTSKYENLENIPDRPDEKQERALISIEKKINVVLSPLNEEARKKQMEQELKTSNLKRDNKKRRRKY